jgi:histone-arginine methyltransferase CARM1
VSFNGSSNHVVLSTSPSAAGTHWYQCRLLFREPIALNATQVLEGEMQMRANESHSYDIEVRARLSGSEIEVGAVVKLQDQMYHYLQQPAAASQEGFDCANLF